MFPTIEQLQLFSQMILQGLDTMRLEIVFLLKDYVYYILAIGWGAFISLMAILIRYLRKGYYVLQRNNRLVQLEKT